VGAASCACGSAGWCHGVVEARTQEAGNGGFLSNVTLLKATAGVFVKRGGVSLFGCDPGLAYSPRGLNSLTPAKISRANRPRLTGVSGVRETAPGFPGLRRWNRAISSSA